MAREFEELALDGHNYPTWSLDVKIGLSSRALMAALTPPADRGQGVVVTDQQKFQALYVIRHHIHMDLKNEYALEEEPSTLWLALKARYEQQQAIILPEALHEWNHIRLQDFKSIGEYNHAIHKICAKLRFCEKEPDEEEKINKTINSMLPSDRILQQQYRRKGYTVYSELIRDLLEAEKHDELSMKIHRQRPIGSAPLPEVHYNNAQDKKKFSGPRDRTKNFRDEKPKHKPRNRRFRGKPRGPGTEKGKSNAPNELGRNAPSDRKCSKCGCFNHSAKKCRTARHLIDLYQKSLGKGKAAASGYEAHFNQEMQNEAGCSQQVPVEPSNTELPLTVEDYMDTENTIIEFNTQDPFGDFN